MAIPTPPHPSPLSPLPHGSGGRLAEEARARRRRTMRTWLMDVYAALDAHPGVFRPVLLLVVAASVGLMVAPDLRLRSYPADASMLGAPMVESIKAPYDIEVIDEQTSERLRDDAALQIKPVFDFDREYAARDEVRIARAFSRARKLVSSLRDEATTGPHAPLSKEALRQVRARFDAEWGVSLGEDDFRVLVDSEFSAELERVLTGLVRDMQVEPLVATRNVLEVGRDHGITIEYLPSQQDSPDSFLVPDRPASNIVQSVQQIAEVDGAKRRLLDIGRHLIESNALSAPLQQVLRKTPDALGTIASSLIEANLSYNRNKTERLRTQARLSVRPVSTTVKKGEMIVRDGDRLTARHLMVLAALNEGGQSSNVLFMGLGGVVLLLVLTALSDRLTGFLRQDVGTLTSRDLVFLTCLFVLSLGMSRTWLFFSHGHDRFNALPREVMLYSLPVAFAPMVTRLVLRAEIALMFCVLHSLVLGLLADGDRMLMIYALCGSVAATGAIHSISSRSDLLRAGLWSGLTQAVAAFGIQLFETHSVLGAYVWPVLAAVAGGIFAAVLALSVTPIIEWAFDYTTDLKLLELANLNHPALKELIVQAPGSYHHSIIVGALVEAAAENIGANPLLARVMAYYHDLGKGCNPGYFIENQRSGQNPHDKLKPSMSAMIIRRHVTDGIELAKRHGLGEQILAGIAQHHGNTLIRVFFHKAQEAAEPGQTVQEADYRYPGIKPQTREAALVMLGDSIEAASRALGDPSAARLTGLVQRIINSKFTDGQLDECDLTLRDLHTIAKSFSKVLLSIYHHRLEYPSEAQADGKRGASGKEAEHKARRAAEDAKHDPSPDKSGLKRLGL